MAVRFTRNITDVDDVKKLSLDTHVQNDLVSDTEGNVYISTTKDGKRTLIPISGGVLSVNNIKPDENGNITIPTEPQG